MSELIEQPAIALPEGLLGTDRRRPDGVMVHSLTAHALAEMDRHRWIESEQRHWDAGEACYQDWLERCWTGWARSKLLEHLYGWRCWSAFGHASFGLLRRHTVERHVPLHILRRVCALLAGGGENLDVIDWAVEAEVDLDGILWLLERIDINALRHRLLTDHIRLFVPTHS